MILGEELGAGERQPDVPLRGFPLLVPVQDGIDREQPPLEVDPIRLADARLPADHDGVGDGPVEGLCVDKFVATGGDDAGIEGTVGRPGGGTLPELIGSRVRLALDSDPVSKLACCHIVDLAEAALPAIRMW